MKKIPWRLLFQHHKKAVCLGLGAAVVIGTGWCVYEYTQWGIWKNARATVQAYARMPDGKTRNMWEFPRLETMRIVQQQSEAYGIQIVSFQAMQREKQQYLLELQGNYESYIQFIDALEELMPFHEIEILQMERNENQIVCKIRV